MIYNAGTPEQPKGYGVLLLNMGGPASLDEIEPYLFRLFSDPDMVHLTLGRYYQERLARIIASRRAPVVRKRYEAIGGRSPIGEETRKQAEGLSNILGVPVEVGMRYARPDIGEAIEALSGAGAGRFVLLPLYPQFSRATSLSAIHEFERRNRRSHPYEVITSHFDDPGYIDALSGSLTECLEGSNGDESTHVLFVAHSIPVRYVKKGDPYVGQVEETVRLVRRKVDLRHPWSLAYHSRIGPVRWQGPSLEDALKTIRAAGSTRIVVLPVSFVSENIETMYDLDIAFREACDRNGIRQFSRVPTLGPSPRYLEALARLVMNSAERMEDRDA